MIFGQLTRFDWEETARVHLSVMADEHEPFSIACGSVLDERGSRRFAYEFT